VTYTLPGLRFSAAILAKTNASRRFLQPGEKDSSAKSLLIILYKMSNVKHKQKTAAIKKRLFSKILRFWTLTLKLTNDKFMIE
jgi:hypothetical protein